MLINDNRTILYDVINNIVNRRAYDPAGRTSKGTAEITINQMQLVYVNKVISVYSNKREKVNLP